MTRNAPEITLGHGGALRGTRATGRWRVFSGIPYAAAPFGTHRLRAPAPAPGVDRRTRRDL